ncbi:MAG: hypothetical protein HW377_1380 [Actinobacteria bacterium]|nr:hypothetical protein [Actinomycetota bacterium]
MVSFPGNRRYISIIGLIIPAAVFLVVLAGLPSTGHSSDLTVIDGIVERVSGSSVTLESGTYDIGRARIKSTSGRDVPLSEISTGRKVKLRISNGSVTGVIVYPAVMLE